MTDAELKNILRDIIEQFLSLRISKKQMLDQLINRIDPEDVYDCKTFLITDSYFTLLHIFEEDITHAELQYLLECLSDQRVYSNDDKNQLIQEEYRCK